MNEEDMHNPYNGKGLIHNLRRTTINQNIKEWQSNRKWTKDIIRQVIEEERFINT